MSEKRTPEEAAASILSVILGKPLYGEIFQSLRPEPGIWVIYLPEYIKGRQLKKALKLLQRDGFDLKPVRALTS